MADVIAYTCTLFFACGLALWLGSAWRARRGEERPHADCHSSRREMAALLAVLVFSRILVYLLAYALSGRPGGFFETIGELWGGGDAQHYIGIAQNGYQTEGDARFHIVFFPLYPLLIAAVRLFFRDYFLSALLVSNAATVAAAMLFYRLICDMYGRETARRALAYLLLFPAALFYNAPYTEGLFLLLSVGCFFFLERERFTYASVCGMLAALTRSVGVLLFVPVALRAVLGTATHPAAKTLRNGACSLLIPAGTGIYVLINKLVTGDALRFLEYQRDHWQQELGNPIDTIRMIAENTLGTTWEDPVIQSMWAPQLVCICLFVLLVALCCKKTLPDWGAYSLCYFTIAVAPTWLLSAPRYLGVLFPCAVALAVAVRSKWLHAALICTFAAGCIYYLYLFVNFTHVY